uniref:Reverse transcriptase Ty1/copia-type domain-containing protein n=1 Tax=Vitis vinifera TaxID=29760 RepID=A5BTS3_VITVI|nr:hypothetical protein VITISV_018551 [Vitis vinifera]
MQGENMRAFQFWETLDLGDTLPLPPPTSQPIVNQQPEVINQNFVSVLDSVQVPNSIQEALKNPEWRKAVSEEIKALEKNGTRVISDLPHGKKPVGCKWIFTIKHKVDGSIERLKARLVAKGFTQSYGIDYRETFAPFSKSITKQRYTQCQADHTLFVKFSSEKKIAVLIVYVDDIILTSDYKEELSGMKKHLAKEFEIKDLGYLRYFLDTSMDSTKKIGTEKNNAPVDRGRYQRLVGRLIYLSHTRPNIGFFISVVSQFMNNPTKEHMEAVNRILRYLKMTSGKGLLYKKNDTRDVEIFSDADWAGIWIQRMLNELGISTKKPIKMFCDNQAAISIAKNLVHHDRTKHIEIDRNFISEKIEKAIVQLVYTPIRSQTADILTKALSRTNFEELSHKLCMYNIYAPA